MATDDKCCTFVPYFKIHEGQEEAFRSFCEQFVELSANEPKCLYYGFSFDGDAAHCREGYQDADGVLAHMGNVGTLFEQVLQIATITRVEVHGPAEELAKLRKPLESLKPQFFTLEYGFRR